MENGRIGVDESGKGDYFGPLVVAACYVGPEHLAELEDVRESKKITDRQAKALGRTIRGCCPHAVVAIGPSKYNELYASMRNLNRILAWGHARAIENVLEQQPATLVVSDQFADAEAVARRLFEKGRQVRLESRVRAEADIAVAAASVLARAEFLHRLEALSRRWGVRLPKGAGEQVVAVAGSFVKKHGMGGLGEVAKLHFKTTQALTDM